MNQRPYILMMLSLLPLGVPHTQASCVTVTHDVAPAGNTGVVYNISLTDAEGNEIVSKNAFPNTDRTKVDIPWWYKARGGNRLNIRVKYPGPDNDDTSSWVDIPEILDRFTFSMDEPLEVPRFLTLSGDRIWPVFNFQDFVTNGAEYTDGEVFSITEGLLDWDTSVMFKANTNTSEGFIDPSILPEYSGDVVVSGFYTLVPAPGAIALLGLGGLIIARRRR